jgi:Tfp pilus tip-associated adhesin PilY1
VTTLKYLKKKNKILKKVTGLTLVPKEQLKNVKLKEPLYVGEVLDDVSICPYCVLYMKDSSCTECPMYKAGNSCVFSPNNTYAAVLKELHDLGYECIGSVPKIRKLVEKFNKEFEKKRRKKNDSTKVYEEKKQNSKKADRSETDPKKSTEKSKDTSTAITNK